MSTVAASHETSKSSELELELERLFRQHYQMLYRTAYSILDNPTDAEDVPQAIFLRLLKSGLPPEMSRNPKGYLYRAAVNVSLNIIRSRKRQKLVSADRLQIPVDVSDVRSAEERDRRLTAAIAELEPASVEILLLRYVHNQSDSAIAKLVGKSRGTIAMRLFRARCRLRKILRSLGEEK
jgi:RNA polymerase sigma-70 factor, ECF subfamily